jgi:hypothetical protein
MFADSRKSESAPIDVANGFGRTNANESRLGAGESRRFIILNGYYAQTWVTCAILGALLLTVGVLIVWRAA